MKKIFVLLLALICVGGVFAQEAAATEEAATSAEVTYGFSGSFGYNVIKDSMTDTWGADFDPENKAAVANPYVDNATGYKVNPWFAVDWATWGIKVSATQDTFNNNDDDGTSSIVFTTEWFKDVEEFSLVSTMKNHNNSDSGSAYDSVTDDGDYGSFTGLDIYSHNFSATLDTELLGAHMGFSTFDLWDTISGNGSTGAMDLFITNSWVEARDMFGMWTALVGGDDTSKSLRTVAKVGPADETGSFSTAFNDGIDTFNTIKPMEALEVYIGMSMPNESKTVVDYMRDNGVLLGAKYAIEGVGAVGAGVDLKFDYVAKPDESSVSQLYVDGPTNQLSNVFASAVVASIMGTTDAAVLAAADAQASAGAYEDADGNAYADLAAVLADLQSGDSDKADAAGDAMEDILSVVTTDLLAGDTVASIVDIDADGENVDDFFQQHLSSGIAYLLSNSYDDAAPAMWLDVDLSDMMEALGLKISTEVQMGSYVDLKTFTEDLTDVVADGFANDTVLTLGTVNTTTMALGIDAEYQVMENLKVEVDFGTAFGTGYNYETATGGKWKDHVKDGVGMNEDTDFVAANYNEANYANKGFFELDGTTLKLKATYGLNDTISLWFANELSLLADSLENSADLADAVSGSRTIYGYYDKDAVSLGADFTASEKSKIGVSFAYNLYMGVPTAAEAMTQATEDDDAAAATFTSAYAEWVSNNYNPYSLSVSYSFSF